MGQMTRHEALARIRARFIERGYPRLLVLAFLVLSGLAAFGFSTAQYRLGIVHMGGRYLIATAVGYVVFLLLMALWIELNRPRDSRRDLDVTDLPLDGSMGESTHAGAGVEFSGGGSGGAGASGGWEGPSIPGVDVVDADEAWPVVAAIVVAAVVLLGASVALFYVVYYAPLLLAEVALDAALVSGIYRRLRKRDAGFWLTSAIRHTWKPAVVIALSLYVIGMAIQWAVPSAQTIGDILR
jgi:hypothetical protein